MFFVDVFKNCASVWADCRWFSHSLICQRPKTTQRPLPHPRIRIKETSKKSKAAAIPSSDNKQRLRKGLPLCPICFDSVRGCSNARLLPGGGCLAFSELLLIQLLNTAVQPAHLLRRRDGRSRFLTAVNWKPATAQSQVEDCRVLSFLILWEQQAGTKPRLCNGGETVSASSDFWQDGEKID